MSETRKAVEQFFATWHTPQPIPSSLELDDMIDYWSQRGFSKVQVDDELAVITEIAHRVQALPPLRKQSDYYALHNKLVVLEALCRTKASHVVMQFCMTGLVKPPSELRQNVELELEAAL